MADQSLTPWRAACSGLKWGPFSVPTSLLLDAGGRGLVGRGEWRPCAFPDGERANQEGDATGARAVHLRHFFTLPRPFSRPGWCMRAGDRPSPPRVGCGRGLPSGVLLGVLGACRASAVELAPSSAQSHRLPCGRGREYRHDVGPADHPLLEETPLSEWRPAAGRSARRPARPPLRLKLKSRAQSSGHVDGGWWPRSRDLSAELPSLAKVLAVRLSSVRRVDFARASWKAAPASIDVGGHTVRLEGSDIQDENLLHVIGRDGGVSSLSSSRPRPATPPVIQRSLPPGDGVSRKLPRRS